MNVICFDCSRTVKIVCYLSLFLSFFRLWCHSITQCFVVTFELLVLTKRILASISLFMILISWNDIFSTENFHQLLWHKVWFLFGSIISFTIFHWNIENEEKKLLLLSHFWGGKNQPFSKWSTYRSIGTMYQRP